MEQNRLSTPEEAARRPSRGTEQPIGTLPSDATEQPIGRPSPAVLQFDPMSVSMASKISLLAS